MSESLEITPELLRSHAGSLRALARGLLSDADAAEDVLQDAWLIAMRRPPHGRARPAGAAEDPVGGWLRTVVRNLALKRLRGDARRVRRERLGARNERVDGSAPDTGEFGTDAESCAEERARILRGVTDAVLSLGEPYRTSVLLRFFEDLPPREIAQRQGVPVSTVKSRLTRAFRQLRASLSREYAGDEAAWRKSLALFIGWPVSLPLGPLDAIPGEAIPVDVAPTDAAKGLSEAAVKAGSAGSKTAFPLLVAVMKTKLLLAGTAVVALGTAFWTDSFSRGNEVAPLRPNPSRSTDPSASVGGPSLPPYDSAAALAEKRTALEGTETAATEPTSIEELIPGVLHEMEVAGVVVDPAGLPVAGAKIFVGPRGHVINRVAATDEHGRFRVRWRATRAAIDVAFAVVAHDHSLGELQELALTAGEVRNMRIEVPPLQRMEAILARVYTVLGANDGSGYDEPIAGFTLVSHSVLNGTANPTHAPDALLDDDGFVRFVEADADSGCARGTGALASGVYAVRDEVWEADSIQLSIASLVSVSRTASLFEDGGVWTLTAPGASSEVVPFRIEGKVVDARGERVESSSVHLLTPQGISVTSVETDEEGRFVLEHEGTREEYVVQAFASGLGLARTSVNVRAGDRIRWDAQLDPGLEIRGRLIDGDGQPLADWLVEATGRDEDEMREARTRTDDEGYFTLTGCAAIETRLLISEPGSFGSFPDRIVEGLWPRAYRPEPSADTFEEIRIERRPRGSLALNVLAATGAPQSDVFVRVWNLDSGRGAWMPRTDEDGATEIADLPSGAYRVEIGSSAHGWNEFDGVWIAAGERTELGALPLPTPSVLSIVGAPGRALDGVSIEVWNLEAGVQSRARFLENLGDTQDVGAPSLILPAGAGIVTARSRGESRSIALSFLVGQEMELRVDSGRPLDRRHPREEGAPVETAEPVETIASDDLRASESANDDGRARSARLALNARRLSTGRFSQRLTRELDRREAALADCGACHVQGAVE